MCEYLPEIAPPGKLQSVLSLVTFGLILLTVAAVGGYFVATRHGWRIQPTQSSSSAGARAAHRGKYLSATKRLSSLSS